MGFAPRMCWHSEKVRTLIGKDTRAVVHKVTRPLDPVACKNKIRPVPFMEGGPQGLCSKRGAPCRRSRCQRPAGRLCADQPGAFVGTFKLGYYATFPGEQRVHLRGWTSRSLNAGVVKLGLEGALILPPGWAIHSRDSSVQAAQPILVYDRVRAEDDYNDQVEGKMVGFSAVFSVALGYSILQDSTLPMHNRLEKGAIAGLRRYADTPRLRLSARRHG